MLGKNQMDKRERAHNRAEGEAQVSDLKPANCLTGSAELRDYGGDAHTRSSHAEG
jgi:hypothetical protein